MRRQLAGAGLVFQIDLRAPGHGIEAEEHVLVDVGHTFDEVDPALGAFQEPEIAVARHVDQAADRPAVPFVVDQDRRGDFIPVPRAVRVVLVVTPDLAAVDVNSDGRSRVEIVPRALIAHPWPAVAGSPVGQICLRVIVAGNPDRRPSGPPLVPVRPGFATRFSGGRYRVSPPQFFADFRIESCDEAANPALASRRPDHDLAVGNQRRQRRVVAGAVVGERVRPDLLAGPRIESDENGFASNDEDFVVIECNPTVGFVRHGRSLGPLPPVSPENGSGSGVDRNDLVSGRRDEHDAVVDEGWRLVAAGLARGEHPDRPQPPDVLRMDRVQGAVTPAIICAPEHQPFMIFRVPEALGRHRLVVFDGPASAAPAVVRQTTARQSTPAPVRRRRQ